MTKMFRSIGVAMAASLVCFPTATIAQQPVNPEAERAATDSADTALEPIPLTKEAFATGRGDLFILLERDIFTVTFEGIAGYTSNAFLSDANRDADTFTRERLTFSADTVIDRTYRVGASIGLDATQYHDNERLGSNTLSGRTYAAMPLGGFLLGVTAGVAAVFDDEIDDHVVTQGDFQLTASRVFPLSRSDSLSFQGALGYIVASPYDFTHARGFAELAVSHAFDDSLVLSGFSNGTFRRYNDYFPLIFTQDRRDFTGRAGTRMTFQPASGVLLRGEFSMAFNESTLSVFDYTSLDGLATIRGEISF